MTQDQIFKHNISQQMNQQDYLHQNSLEIDKYIDEDMGGNF